MNYGPQVTASAGKHLPQVSKHFGTIGGRNTRGLLHPAARDQCDCAEKRDHFRLRGTASNGSVEGNTSVFQDSVGRQLKIRRVRFQANSFGLVRKAERKY